MLGSDILGSKHSVYEDPEVRGYGPSEELKIKHDQRKKKGEKARKWQGQDHALLFDFILYLTNKIEASDSSVSYFSS